MPSSAWSTARSADSRLVSSPVRLRLNGELKQKENTAQFIQDIPTVVSFISQYITLHPGDLIFTGTPGTTSAIKPSDVVEVELEGVGVLRNSVVAEE